MKTGGFALLFLFAASPAHALIGGTDDPAVARSPWAGVGAVTVKGKVFSGALIGNRHVLTAAHVVGGASPTNVAFVLPSESGSRTYAAASISVFPGFAGTRRGADGIWHDDLAVVQLAEPVAPGVPFYALYSGPLANEIVTIVGYGASGDGAKGVTSGARASVRRFGRNRVDRLLADDEGGPAAEVFAFDFDGPDAATNVLGPPADANLTLGEHIEAQYAGGDSGAPAFVNDQGHWKIAGVAAFNASTAASSGSMVRFGALGGGTVVASYLPWIEAARTPVPEPGVWLMLLAGLGVVAIRCRRKGVRISGSGSRCG